MQHFGFSLVESLVSMAIIAVLVLAVGLFQRDFIFLGDSIQSGASNQHEVRQVTATIAKELRTAAPSVLGAYPIVQADNTNLVFYADVNDDGFQERLRYTINGDVLERGVVYPNTNPVGYTLTNEVVEEIMTGVVNGATPLFSYYDDTYTGSSAALPIPIDIPSIRLIGITVLVDTDTLRPPEAITVTTQITLRNLKDNL